MVAELFLAVLSPFVSTLTEHFLNGKQEKVPVARLQDQVIRLMASQRELEIQVEDARRAVFTLTRYLAFSQGEIFAFHDNRLELAIKSPGQRQVIIGHAIEDFNYSVMSRVQVKRNRQVTSRPEPVAGSSIASSEALDRFFEGFEEEIMKERQGRGKK